MGIIKFGLLLSISLSLSLCAEDVKKEEEVIKYVRPEINDGYHIAEPFHDEEDTLSRWTLSQAKKDGMDESIAKYDGVWKVENPEENPIEGDNGLTLKSEAKHAAISSKLQSKFVFDASPLIIQYEVKFQKTQECGGAYVKLLAESDSLDLATFGDKTVYSVMFGPDKCGHEGKMHFIVQHENPISGKMEEHHAKAPTKDFAKMFDDKKTHLVTLVVRPDNTFEILLDKNVINSGSLLNDMTPPINPPKEIDDPDDVKPEDWDEREKIPDPEATKPDDWDEDAPKKIVDEKATKPADWLDDEPEQVPDPEAVKPEDWDTEEDGEWEAPLVANPKCVSAGCGEWKPPTIDNPAYKGKWQPALIANPAYKGIWSPKKIANPNYFEDPNPFMNLKSISAVGFELWSMQSDIMFDNVILASNQASVDYWTAQTWDLKNKVEKAGEKSAAASVLESITKATEEMPWLWAVYAVVILLPFVLIYVFCFPSKDKTAERKKTDEPSPDDVEEDADVDDGVSNRSLESSAEEDLQTDMPDLEETGPTVAEVKEDESKSDVELKEDTKASSEEDAVEKVEDKLKEDESTTEPEEKVTTEVSPEETPVESKEVEEAVTDVKEAAKDDTTETATAEPATANEAMKAEADSDHPIESSSPTAVPLGCDIPENPSLSSIISVTVNADVTNDESKEESVTPPPPSDEKNDGSDIAILQSPSAIVIPAISVDKMEEAHSEDPEDAPSEEVSKIPSDAVDNSNQVEPVQSTPPLMDSTHSVDAALTEDVLNNVPDSASSESDSTPTSMEIIANEDKDTASVLPDHPVKNKRVGDDECNVSDEPSASAKVDFVVDSKAISSFKDSRVNKNEEEESGTEEDLADSGAESGGEEGIGFNDTLKAEADQPVKETDKADCGADAPQNNLTKDIETESVAEEVATNGNIEEDDEVEPLTEPSPRQTRSKKKTRKDT